MPTWIIALIGLVLVAVSCIVPFLVRSIFAVEPDEELIETEDQQLVLAIVLLDTISHAGRILHVGPGDTRIHGVDTYVTFHSVVFTGVLYQTDDVLLGGDAVTVHSDSPFKAKLFGPEQEEAAAIWLGEEFLRQQLEVDSLDEYYKSFRKEQVPTKNPWGDDPRFWPAQERWRPPLEKKTDKE